MEVTFTKFEHRLIKEILTIWNQALPYDVINEERFTQLILLDENFDESLFQLAFVDGTLVGFAYGIRRKFPYLERGLEEARGWISVMAIANKYQHQGIGTQLFHEVETALMQAGAKEITLCAYSPNYFFPGIDVRYETAWKMAEHFGYHYGGDAVSMQMDLFDHIETEEMREKKEGLAQKGMFLRPYTSKDLQNLLQFLLVNFGAGWKRNALMAMRKEEAEKTILVVVDQKQNILGFCMRKIDGNEGRFGPFGVKEDLRSHGIGGILFEHMMQDMKQRGVTNTYLLWTSGAAKRFYERHGMSVFRTCRLYRKKVDE